MCEVSEKLRLCTCSGNVDRLKHYWILFRFIEDKDDYILGTMIPPYSIDPDIDEINRKQLLTLLNEKNIFDVDIVPNTSDRLLLSFGVGNTDDQRLDYGFVFEENKWQEMDFHPFEWYDHHGEDEKGKIKNAIKRKKPG